MVEEPYTATQWHDFNDAADLPVHDCQQAPYLSADAIREGLLARLEQTLAYLFPQGRIRGHQFEVGNLNGEAGQSLKVELYGTKAGLWHDFATHEGGDILDLWAACHDLSIKGQFPQVMRSATDWLGSATVLTQQPVMPSARTVKRRVQNELGVHTAKWDYIDTDGKLIACVYRYDTQNGKQYRPWDVVNRRHCAPNPRPLYNQLGISQATHVVLVEGEKAADSVIGQGMTATTAMQGANAPPDKTDWTPLKGKHVVIWPDNDEAGRQYAGTVADYLVQSQLLLSLHVLSIPRDKPDKWDAADAVAENLDVSAFITQCQRTAYPVVPIMQAYSTGELLDDTSPMPLDLIAPRVLTPEGLMVLGGEPKVGKSHFLLALLAHMAAGIPFLGLTPPRPLRIFYLQTEVGYHYLRERLQQHAFDKQTLPLVRQNLVVTPQSNLLLDKDGVTIVKHTIAQHFPDKAVDIIAVDPLRNVFDGGSGDASENDNNAMLFFLQKRLNGLRGATNPQAGIILAHHTRKIHKKQLEEAPFQALSGASSLRSYYSSGLMLCKPDENQPHRQLLFELRNGASLNSQLIHKVAGTWQVCDPSTVRLVNQYRARKLDAERRRKRDVILQLIHDEAKSGRVYTLNQFCQAFEHRAGLGGKDSIRARLEVLTTKGYIKFFKDVGIGGLVQKPARTKYGFLCVEDMRFGEGEEVQDPDTGEVTIKLNLIHPTHYKCKHTAAVVPVDDSHTWVCDDDDENVM